MLQVKIAELTPKAQEARKAGIDLERVINTETGEGFCITSEANAPTIVRAVNRDHLFDALTKAFARAIDMIPQNSARGTQARAEFVELLKQAKEEVHV